MLNPIDMNCQPDSNPTNMKNDASWKANFLIKTHTFWVWIEMEKTWKCVSKPEKVCQNLRKYVKTWESVSKPEKVWQHMNKWFRTMQVCEVCQTCLSALKSAKICFLQHNACFHAFNFFKRSTKLYYTFLEGLGVVCVCV